MILSLIILIILMLILFMPVKATFEIQNRQVYINIILYGVIKIPLKAKTKRVKHEFKDIIESAREKIRKTPQAGILLKIFNKSKKSLFKLFGHVKVRLILNLEFGLLEPDRTAVTYGLINCMIYSCEGFLKNLFREFNGTYKIAPDFKVQKIDFDSEITVQTFLIYILSFSYKMFFIYLKYRPYLKIKGGNKNAGTSNRRINENYNG